MFFGDFRFYDQAAGVVIDLDDLARAEALIAVVLFVVAVGIDRTSRFAR